MKTRTKALIITGILLFSTIAFAYQANAQLTFQVNPRPGTIRLKGFTVGPPSVTILEPLPGYKANQSDIVHIKADVTPGWPPLPVTSVEAEITYPDLTTTTLPLQNTQNSWYEADFTDTGEAGTYNVRIIAKNMFNQNDQETTWFDILDTTPPTHTIIRPQNQTYSFHSPAPTGDVDYTLPADQPLAWASYTVTDSTDIVVDTGSLTYNPSTGNWESLAGSHPPLPRGQFTITFTAEDLSSNPASSQETFTIFLNAEATTCSDASSKLSGQYDQVTLVQSIIDSTVSGPTACIYFNADNIIFDGGWDQGIVIDGTGLGYGVKFNGHTGNTVQNAEITEFNHGIYSFYTDNNKILNNYIHDNGGDGIIISRANNNEIKGNIIEANGADGILMIGLSLNINGGLIENNTFFANERNGIWMYNDVDNVIVKDNLIWGNGLWPGDYGILIDDPSATGNLIYHNTIKSNQGLASDAGTNQWDIGYPGGGNYWWWYDTPAEGCEDQYSGPAQNQSGPDGICDLPYSPNGLTDNYPWTSEWGWNQ
jgi:parallel beta-helix repeat protein